MDGNLPGSQRSLALDAPNAQASSLTRSSSMRDEGTNQRAMPRPPAPLTSVDPTSAVEPTAHPRTTPAAVIERADAVAYLRGLPSASVDLLITDPAYESLEKHRAIGTTTRLKQSKASSNEWFKIFPNARYPELFAEAYRVLKRNTHLYMFCDQETMFVVKPIAEAAGFRFWKPIVWDKKVIGMGYHYRSRYELILFFEKGKRKLHDLGQADIIEHKRIRGGYPSEKPPEVSRILVRQSSEPGDLVVDPFCGSGSVGVAALETGRRFSGCDICDEAVEVARQRTSSAAEIASPESPSRGVDGAIDPA